MISPESRGFQPTTPEKRINPSERLKAKLAKISAEINTEVAEKYGIDSLVDSNCQISMQNFVGEKGIYEQSFIEECRAEIRKREFNFTGLDNPNIRKFYEDEYHTTSEDQLLQRRKINKEHQKTGQAEMAITALLHKIVGDRYLILRTADLDDYEGADHIIINKETGAVICAFDEVHDEGDNKKFKEKEVKIINKAKDGGAQITFGVKMEKGRLIRSKLEHLPIFSLGLDTTDLVNLIDSLQNDSAEVSSTESVIFVKLFESLRNQCTTLEGLSYLPLAVKQHLLEVRKTLKVFKNIKSNFAEQKAA